MIRLGVLRMSVLQLAPFSLPLPDDAPAGFWNQPETYAQVFEEAPLSGQGPEWQKPWPSDTGQNFWRYYLERRRLDRISGRQAWRKIVPLHQNKFAKVACDWQPPRGEAHVKVEGFLYPHAVSCLLTVTLRGRSLSLVGAVDALVHLRREARYRVEWTPQDGEEGLDMDGVLAGSLLRLYRAALGADPADGLAPRAPSTVTTVLHAVPEAGLRPIRPGDEVHQALHAMCDPQPGWQSLSLSEADWEEHAHVVRAAPVGGCPSVIYFRPQGQAIWFPHRFVPRRRPKWRRNRKNR